MRNSTAPRLTFSSRLTFVCCFLLSFAMLSGLAPAQDKNWDYYKTILDKGMFPPKPKPKVEPPKVEPPKYEPPPPNWKINYKVNMVYKHFSSGEYSVGVQNIKGENGLPVNMFLKKGETHEGEGITIDDVIEDDEDNITVIKITKDGATEEYELASSVAAPGAASRKPTPTTRGSRPPTISRSRPPTPQTSSYRRPSTPTARPKISGKDVQKHLQEYQMEVIRKGLPLLPVALPDDKIQQLKSEGLAVDDNKDNTSSNQSSGRSRFSRGR